MELFLIAQHNFDTALRELLTKLAVAVVIGEFALRTQSGGKVND